MKLPFDHVDQPCAMFAVFGEPSAARIFHEKLLRRTSQAAVGDVFPTFFVEDDEWMR